MIPADAPHPAGRPRGGPRRRPRARAIRPADPLHPAERHRLGRRRDHARRAAGAGQGARPSGHRRQPARRGRHRRPADAGARRARRHHARRRLQQRRDLPERDEALPFDMPGDFTPIAVVGSTPVVLVVNPKVPANNAKEFVALLKSSTGEHELRIGRQRHDPAPGDRDVPRRGRRKARAHSLQGRRPDGHRPDRRPGRVRHRRAAERAGAHQERRAARDRRGDGAAHRRPRRRFPTFAEQGLPNYVVEAWFAVIGPKGLSAGRREARRTMRWWPRSPTPRSRRRWPSRATSINVGTADKAQAVLPQRAREVRGARQEGGHRAAITRGRYRRFNLPKGGAVSTARGFEVPWTRARAVRRGGR